MFNNIFITPGHIVLFFFIYSQVDVWRGGDTWPYKFSRGGLNEIVHKNYTIFNLFAHLSV